MTYEEAFQARYGPSIEDAQVHTWNNQFMFQNVPLSDQDYQCFIRNRIGMGKLVYSLLKPNELAAYRKECEKIEEIKKEDTRWKEKLEKRTRRAKIINFVGIRILYMIIAIGLVLVLLKTFHS